MAGFLVMWLISKTEPRYSKIYQIKTLKKKKKAKIQTSLHICLVWSQSLLGALWVAKHPKLFHADSTDFDQTAWMGRLIWVCLTPISYCCFASSKLKNIWATSWENVFMPYANNKGTDQPAHSRNLISAFLVCCRDSIIPLLAVSKISSLWQAFEAEQAGLCRKPRRQVFPWHGSFTTTQQLMRDGKNMFCETCIFMEWFYWLSLVSQDEVLSSWKDLQQNVSSGVSDRVRHKLACAATEAS